MPVRRAVLTVAAGVLVAGCGLVAGLDEQFGYPAFYDRDATSDGTVADDASGSADDGGDASVDFPDVQLPTDVFTPDGNEAPPDAAEAGCKNPTGACDNGTNACCAPAVCNAVAKCVGQCVSSGCGNEAACCFGKHCDQYLQCSDSCGHDKDGCGVLRPCCLGFFCTALAAGQCQACGKHDAPCSQGYQCCSQTCNNKGKCN